MIYTPESYIVLFSPERLARLSVLLNEVKPSPDRKMMKRLIFDDLLGTLRSEDGDGRENVANKVNSRSFNVHHD